MTSMSYTIIEVANTHGGNVLYMEELIETFSVFKKGFGIKFQPIHPDHLATQDFEWHPVYKTLYFDEDHWKHFIISASETKDVWLDIFDVYGTNILKKNLDVIAGIKLQVSVLFNLEVRHELSKIDLRNKKLILNVAALSIEEIKNYLAEFECLNPQEILLEVGFQGYPTKLEDSGLSKISIVKNTFNKRVVFADHVDGTSDYAVWLPALALAAGADIVEKHVMLNTMETKFDFYSSINFDSFSNMIKKTNEISDLLGANFINNREKSYLQNSILKPILKRSISKGGSLNIHRDFNFKRSGLDGLNTREIQKYICEGYVLAKSKSQGETIQSTDLKTPIIAVIVACRLKSSRLKRKALLPIGGLPSVSYCLRNALKFDKVHHVILATSNLEEDAALSDATYQENIIFHKGDSDDVIQRYLDICRELKINTVVRVTADMPFIDNEICQILLKSHFEQGADFTTARDAAVGTNLEIINVTSLEKIKNHFPFAEYSEYMSWYFMNNEDYFNINIVDLPKELIRDYRLTLDYKEDLLMFNEIHNALALKNKDFSLRDIFNFLDKNESISQINANISLRYKADKDLIDTLNLKTKFKE